MNAFRQLMFVFRLVGHLLKRQKNPGFKVFEGHFNILVVAGKLRILRGIYPCLSTDEWPRRYWKSALQSAI